MPPDIFIGKDDIIVCPEQFMQFLHSSFVVRGLFFLIPRSVLIRNHPKQEMAVADFGHAFIRIWKKRIAIPLLLKQFFIVHTKILNGSCPRFRRPNMDM